MARTITNEIIIAAIDGFEAQKARIDSQIAELRGMLSTNGAPPSQAAAPVRRGGRRISAAGRARIAEAQRKRWAGVKGESGVAAAKPSKQKRRLSPAGRKAIQEALRRRWAAKHAEDAKAETGRKTASHRKTGTAHAA